jgi:hypothetical protein
MGVAFWILSVVAAALSRLLADECKAWVPCFTKWIIRRATARLPEDQCERYKEEWEGHIGEIPGDIGKIVTALGFVLAAKRISSEMTNKRPRIVNAEWHMGPTHPEWAAFCAALGGEGYCNFTEDEAGKLSWHCQHVPYRSVHSTRKSNRLSGYPKISLLNESGQATAVPALFG